MYALPAPEKPAPVPQRGSGHLWPVVAAHQTRRGPALGDQARQHADRLISVESTTALDRERLSRELVNDVQQLEVVPIGV
jgi:hypothetical protein